ncbi:MAG: hypothetical protein DRO12_01495 [Thermoprotei archaeon]|nr:MAG: hypothetical protein DRO12_01495 [Thermoprotei archaeon]
MEELRLRIGISGSVDHTLSLGETKLLTLRIPSPAEEVVEFSLRELMLSSLKELGAPVLDVEIRYSEGIGLYALAILDCDARQALDYWLEIVDRVRGYGIPVFARWTGRVDVEPEEMGVYIGRVLAKMSVFLATREPIDVVKVLREEWGF